MGNTNLKISPAPHIKRGLGVNKIMIDFIIALIPAVFAGIYFYKGDAVKILLASVLASIISEALWNKFIKKTNWITDLSPIVSGIILGLIMPTYVPLWIPVIGAIFATIVVKQFFGGLGQNFMNPAAATKAFLIASWAAVMAKPVVDTTASASKAAQKVVPLIDRIIGQANGSIGEVSILALCIGGLYLAIRGVISLRASFTFIISAFAMYSYFGKEGLLPGAFFLAAIFMATDHATTPMTKVGQYIFGLAAGICASFIAVKGYNPEGPYYAIIILNLFTPLIEYFTTKKVKVKKEAA
ncbi:RnfABCDGE type electron transport complex subunit D [Clostridium septicum]|uniref:RnfABCDGE type electron transport complex subunit D n=1 Tax=Clostridium septicum TaxID=1504 RepID=A0A9N7JJQ6_CLOSE|nr:RnfABCDGE type electron transport complex subunit D [Clostridium septicum]AYE33189.1 RnfABCDGE type electron transport complex subunit D [Clostridium septicum]MDU1315114.1 RnfABCDGE type electron transport complex subunit D [Clostridium septicum]QAS61359.1 RnfABCDGE type electron transport complex subunit D [Clostridium septicum]UEC22209.1 RnfABCDGE type electron transport complex subunit D [Clostridium septicum]USR99762.1 RnfABCDGE type electron transport complex subunit D [Clostridium sep